MQGALRLCLLIKRSGTLTDVLFLQVQQAFQHYFCCVIIIKINEMKSLVAFFEIPCVDFVRAVKFYETIFNCKLSVVEGPTEKMAFFPKQLGKCPGAISFSPHLKPSTDGVLISLSVENMEEAISSIERNSGRVIIPKTKINAEGMGYFSTFIDIEGNRIGLYSIQ